MSLPPTSQQPPPPKQRGRPAHPARDVAVAGVGAVVVTQMLPDLLPPPGTGLAVDSIVATTNALMNALKAFQAQRDQELLTYLAQAIKAQTPDLAEQAQVFADTEMAAEQAFRARQIDRVMAAVPPALALPHQTARRIALIKIFDAEKRYTAMREQAMLVRVMARVAHMKLEIASPEGAYWKLGHGVQKHTLDCISMAERFWPWEVLRYFQPPVHPGCACVLHSKDHAIANGWMHPSQVPNVSDAILRANQIIADTAAAKAKGLTEAMAGDWVALLEEVELRFAKGTTKGGEWARVGGDPGAEILKKLHLGQRGKIMRALLPDLKPLSQSKRGRWTWVKGMYTRIPEADRWEKNVGGVRFHSPPGSTNLYREGMLMSLPQHPPFHPDGEKGGVPLSPGVMPSQEIDRAAELVRAARRARPAGTPLVSVGDGPEAMGAIIGAGYIHDGGTGKTLEFHHARSRARLKVTFDGRKITGVEHTAAGPRQLGRPPKLLTRPPRSWEEHRKDYLAFADALGREHDATAHVTSLAVDAELSDHAGNHRWDGTTWVGPEAGHDIERAGAARKAGRALTDEEKYGVYASNAVTAHEVAHGVNPMSPGDFNTSIASANLEEALGEELGHVLARRRLKETGQHDVLAWARSHPDSLPVRGVYRNQRAALAMLLDQAGVQGNEDRERVMERLKFKTDPAKWFDVLAVMLHDHDPSHGSAEWRDHAEAVMSENDHEGPMPLVADAPRSPGYKADWETGSAVPPLAKVPKQAATYIGGLEETEQSGPFPNFDATRLKIGKPAGGTNGAMFAHADDGRRFLVKTYGGNQDRVATELLANGVYRTLGVRVPFAGTISVPGIGEPDFSQLPDQLAKEPPLPKTHRLSTGIIVREPDGRLTVIEPRDHFGAYTHTFPKGGHEEGLTPQQNAHKELWEETGLHARIVGVVGDFRGDTGTTRYYLGARTGGEPTTGPETEAVKKVTMLDARKLLNRERDQKILTRLGQMPAPKGAYPDEFPPLGPARALAYPTVDGEVRSFTHLGPSEKIGQGFMADALVSNWDFIGMDDDNILWDANDDPVRLDQGGTFEFRAQGKSKEYGPEPTEVTSLLEKGQGKRGSKVTEKQMRAQAAHIGKVMTRRKVSELVRAAPFTDHAMQRRLERNLNARVAWMRHFADPSTPMSYAAQGEDARFVLAHSLARFEVSPEESQALDDFAGVHAAPIEAQLNGGKRVKEIDRTISHMDAMIRDARAPEDIVGYVGLPSVGKEMAGGTFKQKGYTLATTDEEEARKLPAVMRIVIPSGTPVLHPQGIPGEADHPGPDLVLKRGARFKIEAQAVKDGKPYLHATVLGSTPLYKAPAPWKGTAKDGWYDNTKKKPGAWLPKSPESPGIKAGGISVHMRHLESMRDLKVGERVEGFNGLKGSGMFGTVLRTDMHKSARIKVRWDNGNEHNHSVANLRRAAEPQSPGIKSLTPKQRDLLERIAAAPRESVKYRRSIGSLQAAGVEINGEPVPRSAAAFAALQSRGYVVIHAQDRGLGAPAAQRVLIVKAGRDALDPKSPQSPGLPSVTSYHLTDDEHFKLNPEKAPYINTVMGDLGAEKKGLFVSPDPEAWFNGYDYVRPFVAEIEHPPMEKYGGYAGENFLPAKAFPDATIKRVIPWDEYVREAYGEEGHFESYLDHDGETQSMFEPPRRFPDYRYDGPDVRDMKPKEVALLKARTAAYIQGVRPHMNAPPLEEAVIGFLGAKPWAGNLHPRDRAGKFADKPGNMPEPKGRRANGLGKVPPPPKVVPNFRDHLDNLFREYAGVNVSPDEQKALNHYRSAGYSQIHANLRKGLPDPHAKALDAVLNRHPTSQPMTLHRGTKIARELPGVKEGDEVAVPSFMSTSPDISTVHRFGGDHLELHVPAGTPSHYSGGFDQESEMLLGRGLHLHIDKVEPGHVHATVIPSRSEEPPEKPSETVLGVTPYRGKGEATGDDYYETTRYRGFENDIAAFAKEEGVALGGIDRVRGVWSGGGEPSAQVHVTGDTDAVQRVMDKLGVKYNQDAVLSFKRDSKGTSTRFLSKSPVDPAAVEKAMANSELPGATIRADGRLEVLAIDGEGGHHATDLFEALGAPFDYDYGHGELRFKGSEYGSAAQEARTEPAGEPDGGGGPDPGGGDGHHLLAEGEPPEEVAVEGDA